MEDNKTIIITNKQISTRNNVREVPCRPSTLSFAHLKAATALTLANSVPVEVSGRYRKGDRRLLKERNTTVHPTTIYRQSR